MRKLLNRLAVGATALLALAAGTTAAAESASAAPTGAKAPASVCSDPTWGGRYFCGGAYGNGETWVNLPNGERQVFVVGTNHQMYTQWIYKYHHGSGWQSMGGVLDSWVTVRQYDGAAFSTVSIGSDGKAWARDRGPSGNWTEWHAVGSGYFVFDKNASDPSDSRMTWFWARNNGGTPLVGSETWRAGSGMGSENDCYSNNGWLPNGWYNGYEHSTYWSSIIPTMNWELSDKACSRGTVTRSALFIHSKTPSSWAHAPNPYHSNGCIHLSPSDILTADRYSRAHGGPGYGTHFYRNLVLVTQ
ncbi:hypothetical protein DN069_21035 [Streptacidiphilus pinicola]|uniref:YkuD domain-containing protein n=1 Tax=Streptacidiphilus pinicola TaxID=2219663 RepID=A0A2X0K2Z8_9ACTN|nr:hypothetical protein [Streptacidiphilus pinicola]RAG83645.1 hypothetical protein DN069_21035 [Streptacidiphilus pinicola]